MASSQIYHSVENGLIDIGIGYLIERNPNLSTSILYYDTFELVVSPQHPLASMPKVNINSLGGIPLILLTRDTVGRRFADDVMRAHGIEPQVVMELSSSEEIKRMVEINLGAAIISKQSVAPELRNGTLQIVPLPELEVSHPVGVIYKNSRYVSSAMRQFISDLKGMPETQFISSE